MGSEYFEADRDRSASLRLFIPCQQTQRQRLNEIGAADNQNTPIHDNTSFQFRPDCIR